MACFHFNVTVIFLRGHCLSHQHYFSWLRITFCLTETQRACFLDHIGAGDCLPLNTGAPGFVRIVLFTREVIWVCSSLSCISQAHTVNTRTVSAFIIVQKVKICLAISFYKLGLDMRYNSLACDFTVQATA